MPHSEKQLESIFSPPRDEREEERVYACHRMLRYMHGLDIKAQPSLDMASDCLRRAGPDAGMTAILDEMHGLLKSHDLLAPLTDGEGHPLRSAPPLRRRSMVSNNATPPSLLRWLTGFFRLGEGREQADGRGPQP